MSADFETNAAVGLYAGFYTGLERATRKWGPTIERLDELGAVAYLLNEGVDYSSENGFANGTMLVKGTMVTGFHAGAVRDYTGRFPYEENVHALNSRSVLEAVQDKARFHVICAEETARTLSLADAGTSAVGAFLHNIPGSQAVLKPSRSLSSEGVVIDDKKIVAAHALERVGKAFILQELLADNVPIDGLRGINEEENIKLARPALSRELRLFGSYGRSERAVVPVLRVDEEHPYLSKESFYLFVDPDSVPQEALDVGYLVMSHIADATGVPELFLAIDMVNTAGTWKAMEGNAKEPGMPKISACEYIARLVHGNLAEQLVRLAISPMHEIS